MGDLVLKGATSGQITLSPVGTAGTNTLTLPAKTGNIITSADSGTVTQTMLGTNVAGNGPVFNAYQSSAQTALSVGVATKILFQTTTFNANSNYSTANSRFTASIAGKYQFNAAIYVASTACRVLIQINRDGILYQTGQDSGPSANVYAGTLSTLVDLTVGQYVEIYALFGVSQAPSTGNAYTWFNGALVGAA